MSAITLQEYIDSGHNNFPQSQMIPLATIYQLIDTKHFELRVELTDSLSVDHYDHYTSFSLSPSTYAITLGFKKDSSASLAGFDLSSAIGTQ